MLEKLTAGTVLEKRPVLVWHSAAHEHFKEQLYYLLMSIRPLVDARLKSEIKQLLERYGVSQYCVYKVFGSFDILLRVWLPPQVFREFSEDATEKLQNLHSLLHFQTLKKLQCSGFYEFNQDNSSELKISKVLDDLTADRVLKVQREKDAAEMKFWEDRKILRVRTDDEETQEWENIKAFIAFSEPLPGLPNKSRIKIINDIALKLNDKSRGFTGITFVEGTGFCWLLAKVISKKLLDLACFVDEVAEEFGPLGIGTSTFLVTRREDAVEGDSIGVEALREYEPGNRKVATFIPDLYTPGAVRSHDLDKRAIEKFVGDHVLPALDKHNDVQLERDDSLALKGFLEGVIANDRDSAFVALFPRVINAESALRRPVADLAKRCPGAIPSLLEDLKQQDPKVEKSIAKLTLLDSLRAARWILNHLMPDDPWVNENLIDSTLKEISNNRNIIAHGKDFQPNSD